MQGLRLYKIEIVKVIFQNDIQCSFFIIYMLYDLFSELGCTPLSPPAGVIMNPPSASEWLPGTAVTFTCPNGRLTGSATAVCQGDGSWSAQVPSCQGMVYTA